MEKILGTIITIILVFYIIKFVFKLFMPFLLKYIINKKMGHFFTNFDSTQHYSSDKENEYKQEGEVTIKGKKKKSGNISDELGGEYVDYEEIK